MTPTAFDAIIIGTGQAGPFLAQRLTAAGQKVAIVERKLFGGTCVNTGCTPTKAMVASAYAAHMARRAAEFGVTIGGTVSVDMRRVKERKDAISEAHRSGLEKWLKEMENCTVYEGHARFESARMSRVGPETITADRIFINVGGRAAVPPMPGLEHVPYLTNSSMMDIDFVPAATDRCRRQLCGAGIRTDVPPVRKRSHNYRDESAPDSARGRRCVLGRFRRFWRAKASNSI